MSNSIHLALTTLFVSDVEKLIEVHFCQVIRMFWAVTAFGIFIETSLAANTSSMTHCLGKKWTKLI